MAGGGPVVVLGSLNMDLVVHLKDLPASGQTVLGHDVHLRPGGKGANQAVAASLAGAAVSMVGLVGDDEHGTSLRSALSAAAVDVDLVTAVPGEMTGLATVMVAEDGENAIVVTPGANWRLTPHDVEALRPSLRPGTVLLLQMEIPHDVVVRACALGSEIGARVVLNVAPAADLPDSTLRQVEVLVLNRSEAEHLAGATIGDVEAAQDAAVALQQRGPAAVVITVGSAGAVLADAGGVRHVAAHEVPVVDTTGAGDAFVGVLAAVISRGGGLDEAMTAATRAAADAVGVRGAQLSVPGPGGSAG